MTRVSVVLVNYRGTDDTITAANFLRKTDWPQENLEIVVVDNDSGDGSFERLTEELTDCVVVDSGANLGFAGGCNFGVSHSSGEIVAFLNNDARPDTKWLSEAVHAIENDPQIGCVATKVLDWEGETIDYVDSSLAWYGMGYKREAGLKDQGAWDKPKNVLFPTGASMFVPRHIFDELGGFDERFFMFYEDVDFGWRINLAGYDVRYVPTSVAYHRHHGTMNKFGNYRESYLLERNALACLYKNLGSDLLRTIFAPALALAVERSASQYEVPAKIKESSYAHGQTIIAKSAAAAPSAIGDFVDMLPSLIESRKQIQQNRKKTDAQIIPLMRTPIEAAYPLPRYVKAHDALVQFFHVYVQLTYRSKILVVTGDRVAEKMAGPAIRAWEMAKRLAVSHPVRLLSTQSETTRRTSSSFEVISASDAKTIRKMTDWADVIIFQGFFLETAPWLKDSNKVLVVDIYDPMHLEQLEQARDLGPRDRGAMIGVVTDILNRQISRADMLLCASEKQRQFWLGQLAVNGRINANNLKPGSSADDLIAICPFGLGEEPPIQTEHAIRGKVPGIGMDDKVIIWGGGVYNWFDPLSLIRAVDKLSKTHPDVRLYFLGMKHPNPDVPAMRVAQETIELSKALGLTNRFVFFNHDWVPYDQRQNYLLDANVGVSTHFEHVETQFSFRTRILDYLWAGLPIVATDGDSFGNVLDEERIGISVGPCDVDGLATALETLLYDDSRATECVENIKRFATRFEWSNALEPLLEFCARPVHAQDLRYMDPDELPEDMLGFIDPGFNFKRDLKLVFHHLQAGGPKTLAAKISSRLRKYLR